MRLSEVLAGLTDDLELRALVADLGILPPRFLDLDGLRRRRARNLTPREALTLSRRGHPALLLTFGLCSGLTVEQLAALLAAPEVAGAAAVGEADLRLYGRAATRVVVVSLASWDG
ncbi:hypothetical protein ACFFKU_11040 [Kineococcus gynurae]|uniref:Uncharacterized protein n=1 Tax=Kineococcus gynurae TaxID=452979 RepID=A0ABV5LUP5_9ACTN